MAEVSGVAELPASSPRRRPSVVVVGRPNVGKSSLFNRLVGRRDAIVEDTPGVTRDRRVREVTWAGACFDLVDTGGWMPGAEGMWASVSAQVAAAVASADLVLVVVDALVGVTDEDQRLARWVARQGVSTLVVANKIDSAEREALAFEAVNLGLGEPIPLSALHGRGSGELLDKIVAMLGEAAVDDGEPEIAGPAGPPDDAPGDDWSRRPPAVAIVGRPNAGKSTLFNRIVGEDRAVVSDVPGTTTDSVDTLIETPEGALRLVDTAGMRRRARVEQGTERYSVARALRSLDTADVALLVIDASQGVTHQDQRLAERIDAAGCPLVVVLNKWDLLDTEAKRQVALDVADRFTFALWAPVLRVSARTGAGVGRLLPAIAQAVDAYRHRVPTGELNRFVRSAEAAHPPRRGRVLYAVQGAVEPPTFTLFTTAELEPGWLRYLERRLREDLGLGPTAMVFRVRRRSE